MILLGGRGGRKGVVLIATGARSGICMGMPPNTVWWWLANAIGGMGFGRSGVGRFLHDSTARHSDNTLPAPGPHGNNV